MTEQEDRWAKLARQQKESGDKYARSSVATMLARGWLPPYGWTNEDTERLGEASFLVPSVSY